MADLPFKLAAPLASRLRAAIDVEGKVPRALVALGPLVDRDVALVGVPAGHHTARLQALGVHARRLSAHRPLRLDAPDASLDAAVFLWSGFQGVEPAALAEVERVLRPGGRVLVVHDYGRDEVSALRPASTRGEVEWSRRDGPFLRAGFRIHVLHCFWTFASVDEARAFLVDAFGARGEALAAGLRRPRLSWNVAIYHRSRGDAVPARAPPGCRPCAAVAGRAPVDGLRRPPPHRLPVAVRAVRRANAAVRRTPSATTPPCYARGVNHRRNIAASSRAPRRAAT